ncbi:hypothetical protein [Roseivirga sp. 4D4]|uniref:hypothetical protein n=1 Tax=Roseivirga sp. 4D4 TaxID=1889784 RepID=UPI001112F8FC|nr:hypothetical protein [Roseivirga sp. 4D4]
MSKPGLSTVTLDTSELIKGLEALAFPRSRWSLKDGTNMYSALRLSYHLMTRDSVYYDGKVRSENQERIDAAFDEIKKKSNTDLIEGLQGRILPKSFEKEEEKAFARQAIKDAIRYFQDGHSHGLLKRFNDFQFGSGLEGIDQYLLAPIRGGYSSKQLLDNIFEQRQITGRRFYVSIFESEGLLDSLKNWIRNNAVAADDFNLLFTLFRTKLAETKCINLWQKDEDGEYFYEPDYFRGALLKSIPMQNEGRVNYAKVLDEAMHKVWLSKNNFVLKSEDIEVPSILNLPLNEDNRVGFLEAVLDFSRSEFRKQYEAAKELISRTKIQNMEETQKNLEVALRSANGKSKVLTDSGNWVFLSEGQDLAKFLMSTTKELGEDLATEGSVTGLLGAITRLTVKLRGNGIRAGTRIYKSFGDDIVSMSSEDRNIKLYEIFS